MPKAKIWSLFQTAEGVRMARYKKPGAGNCLVLKMWENGKKILCNWHSYVQFFLCVSGNMALFLNSIALRVLRSCEVSFSSFGFFFGKTVSKLYVMKKCLNTFLKQIIWDTRN